MRRYWFLFAFTCVLENPVLSQTVLPDSIEQRFVNTPRDSTLIDKLNTLASELLKSNPALARRIATRVTELAPELQYTRGYARSLRIIGNSYWTEGIYEFAQNYYLLAARQYESIGDSLGLGQAYNNVGLVYQKMGNYPKALEYLMHSVRLKSGDEAAQSVTLNNIGEIYILLNDYERAEQYSERSLLLATKLNNEKTVAFAYNALGIINTKMKKFQKAIECFSKAEEIAKRLGELRLLIQIYQDCSDVYRELGLYEKAEKYLSLSMEMSTLIKVPDLVVNNHLRLYKLDSVRGQYAQALAHLYQYTSLKDSVYSLAKNEQIARLQMIYESEGKERENRQLKIEQQFKESQLRLQRQIIYAISIGLIITGIMAWLLYSQRHKILTVNKILQEKNSEIGTQKLAIEMQATALIKLNEELQELNKNLEERIAQRTKQLTLQNKQLTEYTFINAHKLRAPVSSILGLINLLDQHKPDEYATILTHLKTCGNQLDAITRQISRNLEDGIIEN
jgi:tetratricopeptide (TPR) repeat protein